MTVEAKLNWTDDMQFVARAENGPGIILDNPAGGSGPSPMQMVLMGVAGCTAMDVVSILKKNAPTSRIFRSIFPVTRPKNTPNAILTSILSSLLQARE